MATHKDAHKRNRQAEKARVRNRTYRTRMRNQIKVFNEAIASGENENIQAQFRATVSIVQRLATKGVIHRNQASRRVTRLANAVRKAVA